MIKLGENINRFISEKNTTLENLAADCSIDIEQLSQIAKGEVSPTLACVIEISRALGVTVEMLVDGNETTPITVTRKDARPVICRPQTPLHPSSPCFSMAHNSAMRAMEPYMMIINRVSSGTEKDMSSHEGEEFIYVVRGEIEATLGDKKIILGKGDSVYYDSVVPHRFISLSEESKLLVVLYNPL